MAEANAEIIRLRTENELLKKRIDDLARRIYGKSSEQLDPAQLQLLLDGLDDSKKDEASSEGEPEEAAADEEKKAPAKKKKAANHSRIKGLENLPVEEFIEAPEEYQANPADYDIIGEVITERLDYQPPRCIRQIIKRLKVRRKDQPQQAPILAPAPASPLPGGLPTFNLTAELIIAKFVDHLPYYRQQNIFRRNGLEVPCDTIEHWSLGSLQLLEPIAQAVLRECLQSDYLQADETPIDLLEPGNRRTKNSYLWVLNSPLTRNIYFHWSDNRSADTLHELLGEDFHGVLQHDGYSAYTSYEKNSSNEIQAAGCMAHVRRKFVAALEARERHAAHLVHLLGHLYRIEDELRQSGASPTLREVRRAHEAKPILARLKKILLILKPKTLQKSHLGEAIGYALARWDELELYLTDGRIEIDNNWCENSIRPTKLGAKNYLFFGSPRGGRLAAVAYTLIESCKRNGLHIRDYLTTAMKRLVEEGPGIAPDLTPRAIAEAAWQERHPNVTRTPEAKAA